MGKKRHKPEEVVAKLRQVDVLLSQGKTVAEAIRSWSDGGHLLPLAPGVWWAEVGSGEAAEGPGDREQPSSSGHCRSDAG